MSRHFAPRSEQYSEVHLEPELEQAVAARLCQKREGAQVGFPRESISLDFSRQDTGPACSWFYHLESERHCLIELNAQRGALEENIVHARLWRHKTHFVNATGGWLRDFALLPDARRKKREHRDVLHV